MLIEKTEHGGIVRLAVSGRIDAESATELRHAVSLVDDNAEGLTIDLGDTTYISSAGLRELLICKRRFTDRLLIENVRENVYEIFEITGFNQILSVSPSRSAAQDAPLSLARMSFKAILALKAEQTPDTVILSDSRRDYTWLDVERCAQIIAAELSELGVKRGTHVALCGMNSANWVLTFLAVQKLGAIAVLANFNFKAGETARILRAADVTHFCYGEMPEMKDEGAYLSELSSEMGGTLEHVYSFRNSISFTDRLDRYDAVKDEFAFSVEADDPAVMIFTSGSSGMPKGVLLSSYNLMNASEVCCHEQRLDGQDRMCLIAPMFHIFGLVVNLLPCVIVNAQLFFPDDLRTSTVIKLISAKKITVFHSVPTMLIAMMNNKDFTPEKLSSVRCTIFAGSPVSPAQIMSFRKTLPNVHFLPAYGLSEMAPVTMAAYDDDEDRIVNTVGRPVKNITLKIDANGEILVQGYNLMLGYYKVKIEDQAIDGEGWLHTGDTGTVDAAGYLKISGRIKDIIIRGGENIIPAEVEAAITSLGYVADVKVTGVPSDFFGEEAAACLRLKDGAKFDEESMRRELSGKIARYKVPSYFIVFDEFPVLGSGKIDTVKLKKEAIERVKHR